MQRKNVLFLIIFQLSSLSVFSQSDSDSLFKAVERNDTTAIKVYLKNGADINLVKQKGWAKVNLLITAVNKNHLETAKILIQNNVNINWKDGFNTTALMYAANIGNIKMVRFLLDSGADIKHKDDNGNDALSTAKSKKHKDVVKLLKNHM